MPSPKEARISRIMPSTGEPAPGPGALRPAEPDRAARILDRASAALRRAKTCRGFGGGGRCHIKKREGVGVK